MKTSMRLDYPKVTHTLSSQVIIIIVKVIRTISIQEAESMTRQSQLQVHP
jgi:hypothetical protein